MNLLQVAFVFFGVVASGGVAMAGMIVAKRKIPAFMGPGHGLGGLGALAVLLFAILRNPAPQAWLAFGVFAAGLLGGVVLFAILFRKRAPLPLVIGHGSLAVIG